MVAIEIKTLGKEAMVRGFTRYANLVKDWRPAYETIWDNYREIEIKIFERQGFPRAWKPLSPAYKAWKDVHYPGKKILERTGAMRNSLLGNKQAGAQDTIKDIKKLRAEFGTQLARASAHQDGVPGRLPARPVLQFTPKNVDFWARIIQTYAFELFEKTIPDGPR